MFKTNYVILFFLFVVAGVNSPAQTGNKSGILHKEVMRIIDLAPMHDSVIHHLKDIGDDSSLYQMIVSGIRSGLLNVYARDDIHFIASISFDALKEKIGVTRDTQTVVDPVTNMEVMKATSFSFESFSVNKYKILEDWTFDKYTGKTKIQIVGIGPMTGMYNDAAYIGRKPMFWLRYNDLSSIIARYEQYHPDNTIAGHIWADYFLSDVKPAAQK